MSQLSAIRVARWRQVQIEATALHAVSDQQVEAGSARMTLMDIEQVNSNSWNFETETLFSLIYFSLLGYRRSSRHQQLSRRRLDWSSSNVIRTGRLRLRPPKPRIAGGQEVDPHDGGLCHANSRP